MANPQTYFRPQTLAEAIQRAAQPNSIALVGGALTLGGVLLPYETVIDLQDLDDLKRIDLDEDGLHIGGAASLQAVVDSPDVPDVLKSALTRTVPLNIRNGASVMETLIAKNPPREWLAALVAMNALVEHAGNLQSGEDSAFWEEPLDEFVNLLYQHGHNHQGVIVQIRVPALPAHSLFGAAFVSRTPADKPIVNAAVRVTLDETGRVKEAVAVINGASDSCIASMPLMRLNGQSLAEVDLSALAEHIQTSVTPVSDYLGSAEYRCQMAGVCVRRALEDCRAQLER